MHVCVCFLDLVGGWVGGGEIYLSEQRRIGDREERGEGCAEKKKNDLKEKGKWRRREIYCRVRMWHIKKKVKSLEREKQVSNAEWESRVSEIFVIFLLNSRTGLK